MSSAFIKAFNAANEYGLQQLDAVVEKYQSGEIDLKNYYTRFIQYHLTPEKMDGLRLFLNKCGMKEHEMMTIE